MLKKDIFTYLNNLVAMAYSDGNISEREISFIMKKANELGVSYETVKSLLEDAKNVHFVVPKQTINRISYLDDLIEMTIADNIIHPNELKMCKKVCKHMNIPEEYLEEILLIKNIVILT